MYTLYLDKSEDFVCEIQSKNASLKNAVARIIVETEDLSFMFPGKIKDGKCTVPIKRLKGLLEESSKGHISLEVIVEDTYFTPWHDDFLTEQYAAVKVKVEERVKPPKPIVEVTMPGSKKSVPGPAKEIALICERLGINKKNFGKRKNDFKQVVNEYFAASPEFAKKSKQYIREAAGLLK